MDEKRHMDAAQPDMVRGGTPEGPLGDGKLLPQVERERLGLQLRQAVTGFVEDPHAAVREADAAFDAAAARLTELLAEARESIRTSWQGGPVPDAQGHGAADTEALRLALQRYREHTERLLRL